MIDAFVTRFGLTRMPFGRDLPPPRWHADCGEAAARIAWPCPILVTRDIRTC